MKSSELCCLSPCKKKVLIKKCKAKNGQHKSLVTIWTSWRTHCILRIWHHIQTPTATTTDMETRANALKVWSRLVVFCKIKTKARLCRCGRWTHQGRDCSTRATKRNRQIPTASVCKRNPCGRHLHLGGWLYFWNLIHFQRKVSRHKFYSCKYTQMQNQNRRGACDVEHGGGCFLWKQPLFLFSPCSLGSPSEYLKQGVNSMVDGHTGKGCFFALWLKSRIFCFLGVLEPIKTGKHSGQGSIMMKTERCCWSFCYQGHHQWLALSPSCKKGLYPVSAEFTCRPHIHVGSLWVSQLPPIIQRDAFEG